MEIYQSNYLTIISGEDKTRIDFLWSDQTDTLDDDQFRAELGEQTKAIRELKPKHVFIDTRQFVFPIVPETQEWVDVDIYPAWAEAGVLKIAIVMSSEFLAQLSIEQAFEENTQESMTSKFFDDANSALEWFS